MPRPEEVVPPLVRRHLRVRLAGAEEVAALAGVRGGGGRIGLPSPVQTRTDFVQRPAALTRSLNLNKSTLIRKQGIPP